MVCVLRHELKPAQTGEEVVGVKRVQPVNDLSHLLSPSTLHFAAVSKSQLRARLAMGRPDPTDV